MITAGIDMGSKTVKVVILKDGEIIGKGIDLAGFEGREVAERVFTAALEEAGVAREEIQEVFATGAGRKNAPFCPDMLAAAFASADIDVASRAETIPPEQYLAAANVLAGARRSREAPK